MTVFLVNFVNYLDPNDSAGTLWPKYTLASPQLMTFLDGFFPLTITQDNYRSTGMALLTNLSLEYPLN